MRPTILAVLAFLSTAACTSTGGTWLGLFPAPKFPDGTLENGRYTPPDHSFTVAAPHPVGSYEYRYMEMREHQDVACTLVLFGPAAFDLGVYSAAVHRRPAGVATAPLAERPIDEVPGWVHAYGGPDWAVAHLVRGEHVTLAGQPALFQLFEKPMGGESVLFLASYLFAPDDDRMAEIRGVFRMLPHEVAEVREKLRNRTHEVFEPFAASLQLPLEEAAAGR